MSENANFDIPINKITNNLVDNEEEVIGKNSIVDSSTTPGVEIETTTNIVINKMNTIAPDIINDSSLRFIIVPLLTLLGIIFLAALVYLMFSRRNRRLPHIYCKRRMKDLNLRSNDNSSSPNVSDDDDDDGNIDDVDDPSKALLKGKLQINNHRFSTYQATQAFQNKWSSEHEHELFA